MGRRNCCVSGCKSTSDTHCLYKFPRDNRLRQLWMSFIVPHSSSILLLTKDQLLNRTVCQLHFEAKMFDSKGNRIASGYPCLFTEKEITHGTPLNSAGYDAMSEHSYCKIANSEDEEPLLPCADTSVFILRHKESLEHSYHKQLESQAISPAAAPADLNNTASALLEDLSSTYNPPTTNPSEQIKKGISIRRKIGGRQRKMATKIINLAKDGIGENSSMRIQKAHELHMSDLMEDYHKLNKQTKTFIKMQINAVRGNKKSRRYNLEEKLLCLQMYKMSPKNYKLLQSMFALPNKRTLERLAEKIHFTTGINENIFALLKEMAKKWPQDKKLCSIVFDEVALSTHLCYNEERDVIHGFFDIGSERKMKFCDHALVLMIRGVCSSWRQPLAYYFCEGTIAAMELKNILKEIVSKISQSGLVPMALISDQGSTFRTTYNQLREETLRQRNIDGISDDGTVHISGYDLSIIFDPPHLLKGIRNNFMTKDMKFDSKIAKWDDIVTIYEVDSTLGHSRALPKLTKQHVDKDAVRKMRVSVATQVLSARVAAILRYTDALVKRKDGEAMSPTMTATAEAIEFFDNLFDSVNGRPGDVVKGKLRTAVKPTTAHLSFWQEALKKISNIKFIDKNGKHAYVPSLRGWTTTLESFIRVSRLLFYKHGIEFFYPRMLNQDPLENFFGRLRAHNYRNVNPDTNAFIYTFKTLIMSNALSPVSKYSNCEEDAGEQIFNLELLMQHNDENKENVPPPTLTPSTSGSAAGASELVFQLAPAVTEKIRVHCSAYVAGYVCRKLNKNIRCSLCKKTIITKNIESIHKLIVYREYKSLKHNNLAYPAEKFLRIYRCPRRIK